MKSQPCPLQSIAAPAMQGFLLHQRALGKRFDTEEWTLKLFDRYLVERKVHSLTAILPDLVTAFASSRNRPIAKSYNLLISVLRRWFDWLVAHEWIGESPLELEPRRLTGVRPPFLFKQAQARRLLTLASELPDNPAAKQRGMIYPMIFALLYGLGLRVGEAARLRVRDIDWDHSVLAIRETKFLKSRLVPMGPKMAARLKNYLECRERHIGCLEPSDPLFSFGDDKSRPIHVKAASRAFTELWPKLGIQVPPGVGRPRLHCLRHSFAVGTLLRWYRQGVNPNDRLLWLSTFMGHSRPSSTAVYLTITGELLDAANTRFRRFAVPLTKGTTP